MMDAPILLVHILSQTAMQTIRDAQTRLLPIYTKTYPQYLWLLSERLKGDDFEGESCSFLPVTDSNAVLGAKAVSLPPPRDLPEDQEAIWRGIAKGTFTIFSSDHSISK
jgi:dihydropyrimidinase